MHMNILEKPLACITVKKIVFKKLKQIQKLNINDAKNK